MEDLLNNKVDVVIRLLDSSTEFTPAGGESMDLMANTEILPLGEKSFKNYNNKANVIGIQIRPKTNYSKFWHELGHVFWLTSPNDNNKQYSNAYYYYNVYLNINPQFKNQGGHSPGNIQNKFTDEAEKRYFAKKKR